MKSTFDRSVASLDSIFAFTDSFFEAETIDPSLRFAVNFTVEELFTNMVKYNVGGRSDILISLEKTDDGLVVSLTDFDVEPFDVSRVAAADTDAPIEQREAGGLGIHLVRKMVDSIDYDYSDGHSRITFTKTVR